MGQPMMKDPLVDSKILFRHALGQFATGVTIVTCQGPNGPMAITANSFNSVSLDPALVLWSSSKTSKRYPAFVNAQHYAIHILGADQIDICKRFAKSADHFEGLSWSYSKTGVPLLDGCLARFECKLSAHHEGGDHTIIVGEVQDFETNNGTPLIFAQGDFLT
jgi:flavin reductase (DIM6/NTAB) family NADH-FMN oxidoreductase RutF